MKTPRLLTLLLALLAGLFVWPAQSAQVDLPAGSSSSGLTSYAGNIVVLPNGNIVVVDTGYSTPGGATSVGVVYLLDGATLSVISGITGSTAGDTIGGGGITVLTNGNFVINSLSWHNGAAENVGAVTWGSATTGVTGVVSASNSLVGSTSFGTVGGSGVTPLNNGHYVVNSAGWDNPTGPVANVGAVTWCNGSTAGPRTVGLVTASNSLIGGTSGDQVGGNGVTPLTSGHYVVNSAGWDNPTGPVANVGAVTWCNGSTAGPRTVGLLTASNSLIGGTSGDQVGGAGVTPLTNGHYVVSSSLWDNPAGSVADVGATTWCNGDTAGPRTAGLITAGNSLIGGTTGDSALVRAVALTNGHYVAAREQWDNPAGPVANVGAVTWANGDTAGPRTVGLVTASNSLVGGTSGDSVGQNYVTSLSNGHYVVHSPQWDNPIGPVAQAGAVTWCNGDAAGPRTAGLLTASNSLIGGTSGDQVGTPGVTPLTNGHYVVGSYLWDNPTGPLANVGAVTWCNGGTAGPRTVGLVTASNSLVGGKAGDVVGNSTAAALTNGNYVVVSWGWANPVGPVAQAGAVTWCNGATGTVGVVATGNSLIGGRINDKVGIGGVTPLANGHYVVRSPNWDHPNGFLADVGAVTWGDGGTATAGLVTPGNSLIGRSANDQVGNTAVTALANGDYMVQSYTWDNLTVPTITDARAVTFGNGAVGKVTGFVSASNSVLGTVTNGISGVAFDSVRTRIFAGRGSSKILSVFTPTPVIGVQQPTGTDLSNGITSVDFGGKNLAASSAAKTFRLTNTGTADLTLSGVSVTGGQSGDFTVNTTGMLTTVPIASQTSFTVTFTPSAGGTRSTTLSIASNDATANPFLIALAGSVLSATTDTDGDGLNDLSEAQLADLGFDWQVSQPALVSSLFSDLSGAQANLNAAGFYTTVQVQALYIGTPLLQKSGAGTFTLTIGVKKAANLGVPFTDFPLTVPQTTINGQGKLEFEFTVPDDAAFFRLETQ